MQGKSEIKELYTLIRQGGQRVRPGPILPCGHHYYTLETCGNRRASRAETLIPGGLAGLFGENGVVFLKE